jgi:HK97 family phage prohead protease
MKNEVFYRAAESTVKGNTLELSFASEVVVNRAFGDEKLICTPEACDLSRLNSGGPLLFNHDTSKSIGVVDQARVDSDRKVRASVRFSRSTFAQEVLQDVKDGVLQGVSVGYRIVDVKIERRQAMPDLVSVTKWLPFEVSICPVAEDLSVGVNRSLQVSQMKNSIQLNPDPAGGGGNTDNRVKRIFCACGPDEAESPGIHHPD